MDVVGMFALEETSKEYEQMNNSDPCYYNGQSPFCALDTFLGMK
jgi:hypothetical protein